MGNDGKGLGEVIKGEPADGRAFVGFHDCGNIPLFKFGEKSGGDPMLVFGGD